MREAIRHRVSDIAPGWDVVLIAREGIRDASFATVDRMVDQLLRRASLLPPDEDPIDRAATGPGTH
jgi:ribonuclease P protein component